MEITNDETDEGMDVEVKTTSKRKASSFLAEERDEDAFAGGEEQTAEDIRLINFFGDDFKVPTIFWGVYKVVEEMGLLYLHRKTYKPLMIVRRCEPTTKEVVGYDVLFQTKEEKEIGKVAVISMKKELMGINAEERMLTVCHQLDQIADRYIKEAEEEEVEERKKKNRKNRSNKNRSNKKKKNFVKRVIWSEEELEQQKQEKGIKYCDEFLALLDLTYYVDPASEDSQKKRRFATNNQ